MPITDKIKDMFIEPIRVRSCPLCGSDVYSENDPSDEHLMSEVCSVCNWNQNQFLSWEEANEMLDVLNSGGFDIADHELKNHSSLEKDNSVTLYGPEAMRYFLDGISPDVDYYSHLNNNVSKDVYNKDRESCSGELLESLIKTCNDNGYFIIRSTIKEDEKFGIAIVQKEDGTPSKLEYDFNLNEWE